jgi:phospholipase C
LTDVKNGTLPDVSYVVPHSFWSDHANSTCTNLPMGPDFVGAIVDAIGESKYWNDTAIFVTWDDWGGWYDHIAPRTPLQLPNDPYEYGFRVPLIAVSPYARNHTVDGTYRDFTAILRFIERVNGLPAIASDSMEQRTDDLTSMFRFGNQTPAPFQPIATAHSPAYWAALPSPLPACIAPTPFPTPSGGVPSGAAPPAEEF